MPNGKRDNRPTGRRAAGSMGEASGQARDVGDRIHEGMAHVGEQTRATYDSARRGAVHRYRRVEGLIAGNPTSSVLVGFGVGFGVGVLLTLALSRREEPSPWSSWHMPDSLRNIPDRLRHVPEALARHMPEAIARHMG